MSPRSLQLPDPDLRALASGETIVAFLPGGTTTGGELLTLIGSGPRPPQQLKPAYRRWASDGPPPGTWTATVETVLAATSLDPEAGAARHILTEPGAGDLIVLRVVRADRPVLSDVAFAARRASLDAALRS